MVAKKQNKEEKKTASFGKQKRKSTAKVNHANGDEAIISNRAKTDILAVVLIIVGVALFAVSLVPTDAPVSSFLVNALRFIFGVGVFILPFALII